ncbi:CidA/LrgA family protein [Gluconobacter wancherniae]|nr:CidA/LrgA family protein [Gluconobacter wancherniae]
MIQAIGILLTCQLAGEVLSQALNLPLPGPVIGLIILILGLFFFG